MTLPPQAVRTVLPRPTIEQHLKLTPGERPRLVVTIGPVFSEPKTIATGTYDIVFKPALGREIEIPLACRCVQETAKATLYANVLVVELEVDDSPDFRPLA